SNRHRRWGQRCPSSVASPLPERTRSRCHPSPTEPRRTTIRRCARVPRGGRRGNHIAAGYPHRLCDHLAGLTRLRAATVTPRQQIYRSAPARYVLRRDLVSYARRHERQTTSSLVVALDSAIAVVVSAWG